MPNILEDEVAFPRLSDREVAGLRAFGGEKTMTHGEVLYAEGERGFCFYVVLSGSIEIVEHSSGTEKQVVVHGPGQFTGDVDMLTGRAAVITARALEAGQVLKLGADALRHAVEALPDVGERLLKAFLSRRALLLSGGFKGIRLIGSRFSPDAHRLRDFATRNQIPFTWIDLEEDEQAEALIRQFRFAPSDTPVIIGLTGQMYSRPTVAQLAHCAGLEVVLDPADVFDFVVVGAGPAGLAASVYAASEGLSTLTFEANSAGGQAGTSSRIENYLGFPAGISGAELTRNALMQANKFGARVSVPERVVGLRLEGELRVIVLENGTQIHSKCVLVASGVEYRKLDVPGFAEFDGAGIYYAATEMEARLCRGEDVVVVGGGNSAGQAIVYLARFARTVHVVIRARGFAASMSRYLADRVEGLPNVVIHQGCTVSALSGDSHLRVVTLRPESGEDETIPTSALFMFIGAAPYTSWLRGCVQLDANGFVLTGDAIPRTALETEAWSLLDRLPGLLETSLPGVFAAGDARSGSMKRVSSAVGEGAMAVSLVHQHLGRDHLTADRLARALY
jgi:thioredoxin reductase (NADPH)